MAQVISDFKALSLQDAKNVDESQFPSLSNEQKALGAQYETLSGRLDETESLIALNDGLRERTFVVGDVPSKYDITVFTSVLPKASEWKSAEDIAKYRHILRWVDLIQHTLLDVPELEQVKIDFDITIPREIKEKKKATKGEEASKEKGKESKKTEKKGKTEGEQSNEEDFKAKVEAQKAKKAAKAKAKAESQAKQQAAAVPPNPSMVDFRVGFIQKAVKHPNADSLYVSTIDVGDSEGPRTVCSGLVKYIPLEEMQERYIVTICNLKPVTMRGVKSCAMVLCASDADKVEFVNPPAGSKPGDKIFFEGFDGTPEKQLNPKKKIFETIQPRFSTNENFEITYTEEGKDPKKLVNAKGELCKNSTIVNAEVK